MKNHSGGYDPLQIAGGDATHLFYSIHPNRAKTILNSEEFKSKYLKGKILRKDINYFNCNTNFYNELREYVNKDLEKNNISIRDSIYYKLYNFLIIFIFFYLYYYIFIKSNNDNERYSLKWFILFIFMIMIEFMIGVGIAHEAHHGGIAKPKEYREFIKKLSINSILGGWSYQWMDSHNVNHHGNTNTHNDSDKFYSSLLRLHDTTKLKNIHKYQYLYCWILYSIVFFPYKIIYDLNEFRRLNKNKDYKSLIYHILFKFIWYLLFIIIPYINGDILLSLIYQLLSGLYFTSLFVVNHNQIETNNKLDKCFATHQINTSSNYSSGSYIVNLLTGGLNHQIEHHLFPSYSHHTYPQISYSLRNYIKEKNININYNNYNNIYKAIYAHIVFLKMMGKQYSIK